jgi:Glycine-rich domain-containing protein-like
MSNNTFLYKLNNLDLQTVARKLMSKSDGRGWTFQQTEVAIARYKMFLHLQFLFPNTQLVPTKEIDEVWHAHILTDTRRYIDDCENLYGYILHHRSSEMECKIKTEKFFEAVIILGDIQAAPCVTLPVSACVTLPFTLKTENFFLHLPLPNNTTLMVFKTIAKSKPRE